jgi:hypothetical protein
MNKRIIGLVTSILFSCSTGIKENVTNNVDSTGIEFTKETTTEFTRAISVLPQLTLPFQIYCEKCCDMSKVDQENESIRKFIPAGTGLVGIINKNDKHVAILTTFAADMIVPVVRVYDLNGKQLSEQGFMTGWCGRDVDFLGKQYFTIGTDMTLSDIDSSYSFEMDSTYVTILDTHKIEVRRIQYRVNEDGLIVENNARQQ